MEESGSMNIKKRNSCILYVISVVILCVLDQFTKYLASTYLKNGRDIILIKDIFQLHYLENQGAAFGLLQGKSCGLYLSRLLCWHLWSWFISVHHWKKSMGGYGLS